MCIGNGGFLYIMGWYSVKEAGQTVNLLLWLAVVQFPDNPPSFSSPTAEATDLKSVNN